jgi:hypothetical protein
MKKVNYKDEIESVIIEKSYINFVKGQLEMLQRIFRVKEIEKNEL